MGQLCKMAESRTAASKRASVLVSHLVEAGTYTLEEVAKHNTATDCWVAVNDEVLDVTEFLSDHPGGKKAIMLFAGKDASEEFNMLHKPDVVHKYLEPEQIL